MNKRPFIILSSFLLLFLGIEKDRRQKLTVLKHRLPDLSSFPVVGDKFIISIRDGSFSKAMSGEQKQ